MKLHSPLLLLFFSFTLLSSRCKKQNTEPQLPPETTTGAMTFGCKVNGKVFVPKGSIDGPAITAQYIFLGNGFGGGWWLNLSAVNRYESKGVYFRTDTLLLLENNVYSFKREKGYPSAEYAMGLIDYFMENNDTGNIIITRHDLNQRILSGRFSFTATSNDGQKVNITDGRFDVRY